MGTGITKLKTKQNKTKHEAHGLSFNRNAEGVDNRWTLHVLSGLGLCLTLCDLWTIDHQVPLSMGFFRQEYWNRFPCPPPGDLSDPGLKPASLTFPALAGGFFTTSINWEAQGRHWR